MSPQPSPYSIGLDCWRSPACNSSDSNSEVSSIRSIKSSVLSICFFSCCICSIINLGFRLLGVPCAKYITTFINMLSGGKVF
jgi:hypothetical protein